MVVTQQIRHLLVDGNNVGRAWGYTGKLWRKDPDAARALVVEAVKVLHDAQPGRVSVVFDGRGAELDVATPTGEATFVVAYSPSGVTADTIIERWVSNSRDPEACVVVTADRALRDAVAAMGAETFGSRELRARIDQAEAGARRSIKQGRQEFGGRIGE
jgi:predicted RNA-binding protein with PIN domain